MRNAVAVLLCVSALAAGCRQQRESASSPRPARVRTTVIPENEARKQIRDVIRPLPLFLEKSLLGGELAADGGVVKEQTSFQSGQPVYLTLRLHDSPPGLRTSAKWMDAKKKEIFAEQKEMKGAKIATFALQQAVPPGKYRVEGYWGGNLAADKTFDVVSSPPATKKHR